MRDHADHYVNGQWVTSTSDTWLEVENPATEETFARVLENTPAEVDAATTAAAAALANWSATDPAIRVDHLRRLHAELTSAKDTMVSTISTEIGAPVRIAQSLHVDLPLRILDGLIGVVETFEFSRTIGNSVVHASAIGAVAAITPWNFPLYQIIAKVPPALAAGCTVVLKPSELSPLSARLFTEAVDRAGFPAGVFNLVNGGGPTVGEALVSSPAIDAVSFTGSSRAGERVAALAAADVKRVSLELGGKSANVVLPDGDLEAAIKVGVGQCFANSGQACLAWTRLLVPADRYDEAVELAASRARAWSPGDPSDSGVKMGPVVSRAQRDRVLSYIEGAVAAGATVATGGTEFPEGLDKGYFVRPTVLSGVTPDMVVAQEEVFGPVLSVLAYRDEADALEIANGTPYGLTGAVWSADVDRATAFARKIRAGQIDINGGGFNVLAPFGGFKKSGYGRELGILGFEEFLQPQSLQYR
jgi:aldehyde dehydrogenase (NAD+)